ncbi:hypothetical protein [Nocardioides sp. L-11A]|uniref:hypothetical protein n=1 Tax=Nocardioides sp. L-11A TaxID=3043848 RepID=UPI00249BBC21|nr:hypothetical protein QJ852_03710 [Nocardioides sp. L-11A]
MSDQQQPPAERPVLNGLVALIAVGLGVGLILGVVALVGTKVLGIGADDGDAAGESTVRQSMYLPTPVETDEATGPLVTLHTEDTDEPTGDAETAVPEDEPTTELTSESAAGQISLQALATSVASGERIYFSGVYPGGEGAILWVQRFENGDWADFPASVGVTNGTFSSYIFTGVSGVNRFRVVDRDSGTTSNEISVTVG